MPLTPLHCSTEPLHDSSKRALDDQDGVTDSANKRSKAADTNEQLGKALLRDAGGNVSPKALLREGSVQSQKTLDPADDQSEIKTTGASDKLELDTLYSLANSGPTLSPDDLKSLATVESATLHSRDLASESKKDSLTQATWVGTIRGEDYMDDESPPPIPKEISITTSKEATLPLPPSTSKN